MDWEVVGSTGEWAGAIAVVITLFYLARQIKDSNAVARGAARQAISQMNMEAWSVSIDSRVLALASTKVVAGDALSPEEQGNYNRWIIMRMRFIENAFYQYQGGLLSSDEWIGYRQLIPYLVGSQTPGHENWKLAEVAFSPPFISEVDRVVSLDQGRSKASI